MKPDEMSQNPPPPRTEGSNPSLSATSLPGKSRDTRDKTKPRTVLPDGSPNPEYRRWYRSTPEGRAQVKKWNNSAAGKKAQEKFHAAKKALRAVAKTQKSKSSAR